MKKIEAYKTNDGLIFETENEAEIHEFNITMLRNKDLSKAEYQVYNLAVNGLSNQEIADKLDVQLVTVKKHMGKIMEKFSVSSRYYLIVKHYQS